MKKHEKKHEKKRTEKEKQKGPNFAEATILKNFTLTSDGQGGTIRRRTGEAKIV